MKRSFLIINVCVLLASTNFAYSDINKEFILSPAPESNINRCLIYSPIMGVVKDGQDLKINSNEFEFTDDQKLILKGDVELDFPEGLLRADKANLDRENGKIQFFNRGEIFLEDFYFDCRKWILQ